LDAQSRHRWQTIVGRRWVRRSALIAAGVVGLALTASGGVAYILWPSSGWWWMGQLLGLPLIALVAATAKSSDPELAKLYNARNDFGGSDGPWGAPP